MKAIFVRSPYSIKVDFATQIETKLELYLWNRPNVSPTLPNYTFSMLIPSTTQRTAYYNIANECQEFIENINPIYTDTMAVDTNSMFAYAKAITSYRTVSGGAWTQYSTETFICLYGYTEYSQGVNYSADFQVTRLSTNGDYSTNIPMAGSAIYKPYINFLLQGSGYNYYATYSNIDQTVINTFTTTEATTLLKVPLEPIGWVSENNYTLKITDDLDNVYYLETINQLCENKYTPLLCSYINKFGGWENIWFMKLSETTITAKGTDYNLSPNTFNYNIYKGQSKSFNRNGKKSIRVNTGFVDEGISTLITELLMSETIILNNEPVTLKSESQSLKQWLKDKNINYTLEFEYKNNLINTVV